MKKPHAIKTLLASLMVILVTSCSQDDIPENDSLFGKWQLVEIYDGGSLQPYRAIENGSSMTFYTDSTLTTTYHSLGCSIDQTEGSYETTKGEKGEELTVHLSCEDKELTVTYYYGINSEGHLVISPKESSCDEGCSWKFKRIETTKKSD
ncbi:MAG: lipocalin family protein [Cytophagia bacterium]|nr:lipocalin family protein [Cytophagia bacterium]